MAQRYTNFNKKLMDLIENSPGANVPKEVLKKLFILIVIYQLKIKVNQSIDSYDELCTVLLISPFFRLFMKLVLYDVCSLFSIIKTTLRFINLSSST
jgi:hypothetical protein